MALPLVPLLLNLTLTSTLSEYTLGQKRQTILYAILCNQSYDPRIAPNFEDNYPTKVTVQMYVLSFDSVDEASMEYSLTIYLRQNWTDKRLMWEDDTNLIRLEVDTKMMTGIWMPDLYFVNEKEAKIHDVTVPNRLLHVYPDGSVQSSMRISMTLSCDMYLEKYPHDVQTCFTRIGSYSYTADNILFKWHSPAVIVRPGLTLPRFEVEFAKAVDCEFLVDNRSMIIGKFSCIRADFRLSRLFGYCIAQVYVPSVLIVALSWVSFWIDIDAIPARVSLGLLTVLTMTTQSTGARNTLPKVSYIKAIDVWMAMCLVFVFAALLEFAYVNVQSRVEKRRQESVMGMKMSDENGERGCINGNQSLANKEVAWSRNRRFVFLRDKLKRERARMADKISRVVFPFTFFAFNLAYWFVYRM